MHFNHPFLQCASPKFYIMFQSISAFAASEWKKNKRICIDFRAKSNDKQWMKLKPIPDCVALHKQSSRWCSLLCQTDVPFSHHLTLVETMSSICCFRVTTEVDLMEIDDKEMEISSFVGSICVRLWNLIILVFLTDLG